VVEKRGRRRGGEPTPVGKKGGGGKDGVVGHVVSSPFKRDPRLARQGRGKKGKANYSEELGGERRGAKAERRFSYFHF